MTNSSSQALVAVKLTKLTALALLAGAALTSCAPATMPPQQVQASNPTVTYKYRGDQELVSAQQNASAFCARYQSVPQTASLTNDSNGNRVVVFECVPPPRPWSCPRPRRTRWSTAMRPTSSSSTPRATRRPIA